MCQQPPTTKPIAWESPRNRFWPVLPLKTSKRNHPARKRCWGQSGPILPAFGVAVVHFDSISPASSDQSSCSEQIKPVRWHHTSSSTPQCPQRTPAPQTCNVAATTDFPAFQDTREVHERSRQNTDTWGVPDLRAIALAPSVTNAHLTCLVLALS